MPNSLLLRNGEPLHPSFNYERFAAKRMGATTIEVPSSHVAMLAKPEAIAELIIQAATKLSA